MQDISKLEMCDSFSTSLFLSFSGSTEGPCEEWGRRIDEGAGDADMEELALEGAEDSCFFFRNWALRLAFRLFAEGLIFFLVTGGVTALKPLLSREKENLESMLREKLKALPWLASAWQKAKH